MFRIIPKDLPTSAAYYIPNIYYPNDNELKTTFSTACYKLRLHYN